MKGVSKVLELTSKIDDLDDMIYFIDILEDWLDLNVNNVPCYVESKNNSNRLKRFKMHNIPFDNDSFRFMVERMCKGCKLSYKRALEFTDRLIVINNRFFLEHCL